MHQTPPKHELVMLYCEQRPDFGRSPFFLLLGRKYRRVDICKDFWVQMTCSPESKGLLEFERLAFPFLPSNESFDVPNDTKEETVDTIDFVGPHEVSLPFEESRGCVIDGLPFEGFERVASKMLVTKVVAFEGISLRDKLD